MPTCSTIELFREFPDPDVAACPSGLPHLLVGLSTRNPDREDDPGVAWLAELDSLLHSQANAFWEW